MKMANSSSLCARDLTAANFDALMSRLDTDRNRAGDKYEEIRWKLVSFFQWSTCLDAEKLADEAFDRVAEKLVGDEENIQNVVAFLWGVARKVRLEALRRNSRTVLLSDLSDAPSFADWLTIRNFQNEPAEDKLRLKCLRRCILSLSVSDRRLLMEYYSSRKRIAARRKLAQEYGLTKGALRLRATRLRSKVEALIKEYLTETED
jgi:DNA-directed RNA polymerase specialized sigma24 family protein